MAEQPVTRTPLLTAELAGGKHVERVEIKQITMAPKLRAGLHLHPCPVVGQILAGQVLFQIEGQEPQVLRPGDAFFEPAGERILHFDALDEPVTFVAYYLLGAEDQELIVMLSSPAG